MCGTYSITVHPTGKGLINVQIKLFMIAYNDKYGGGGSQDIGEAVVELLRKHPVIKWSLLTVIAT